MDLLKVDATWVLQNAILVFERCMGSAPRIEKDLQTGESYIVQDFAFNPDGALRALAIIGKHIDVQAFQDRLLLEAPQFADFVEALNKPSKGKPK